MILTDLPEEIIVLILYQLDTKTIKALYETCIRLKHIVSMPNVIRECNFSLSTLSIPRSLKSEFFKHIANHLQVLDLCGVQNLSKTALLPAMKKLKNLTSLNVAHTNITIKDLLDVHKACPSMKTVKSVTINLTFGRTRGDAKVLVPKSVVSQCQNMFKNFDNVHFVYCSTQTLLNGIVFILLKEAHLVNLKCTDALNADALSNWVTESEDVDIGKACDTLELSFNDFSGHTLLQIMPQMYLEEKEYIIVRLDISSRRLAYDVHCSPLFEQFFTENFGIIPQTDLKRTRQDITDLEIRISRASHDILLMVWNKILTEINDALVHNLYTKIQLLFPLNLLSMPQKSLMKSCNKNWIYLHPDVVQIEEKQVKDEKEHLFKRRRVAPPSATLNCDDVCKDKQNIFLTIFFLHMNIPLTLSSRSTWLKEITHINLSGYVVYDVDFFNTLLKKCTKLATLDVELNKTAAVARSFSKCLPLSHSLKNVRLVDNFINFGTLFSSLSQCKTLENIHIFDKAQLGRIDLPSPLFIFSNCANLYSFGIRAAMSEKSRMDKLRLLNNVKASLGLYHLHIDLIQGHDQNAYEAYESHFFLSVFKPVPTYDVGRERLMRSFDD